MTKLNELKAAYEAATKGELTQSRVQELLSYSKETGKFTWKVTRGKAREGSVAGSNDGRGYTKIAIDGSRYYAHRLVYFYLHGLWPNGEIDHIDRDRTNNKLTNLREVTHSANVHNSFDKRRNTSGVRGVTWCAARSKWQAQITVDGAHKHLGRFDTIDEARSARLSAEKLVK